VKNADPRHINVSLEMTVDELSQLVWLSTMGAVSLPNFPPIVGELAELYTGILAKIEEL
jgi:hypothetical protein